MIDWKNFTVSNSSFFGSRCEISPESIGTAQLLANIISSGEGCLSKFYQEGYSDTIFEEVKKLCAAKSGRKIYESIQNGGEEYMYIWDDAVLEFSVSKSKHTVLNFVSANEGLTAACKEIGKQFSTKNKKGYVFAITKGSSGLMLTRVGFAGSPLERGNYSDSVNKDYDYVVRDLKSKDPSGRMIILDGKPGAGKTRIVKALFLDASGSMFVVVPPNMIASMGGPELLPLLLQTRESYGKKGPTVLVLEDADQCLAPRQADNISSISTILNLGDGIFGSLFDTRIIATTNANAKSMDEAIVRDGRLSKRISVPLKSYNESNVIFKRLINDENKDMPKPEAEEDRHGMKPLDNKSTFSLGYIYKKAREAGWIPEKNDDAEKDSVAYENDDADDEGSEKYNGYPDSFSIADMI